MLISVGILAHNEADEIGDLISDLGKQTLLSNEKIAIEIHVVANGCTDATVEVSSDAFVAQPFRRQNIATYIQSIDRAGKSNAWNEFVHTFASPKTDFAFFLDADIRMPEKTTLQLVLDSLIQTKTARVAVDESVKDLSSKIHKTIIERLILAASQTAYDTRTAICGQLYCVRFEALRQIWMPVGLPGEDGFLRAMILTSNFTKNENFDRIVFVEGARHIFESERSLKGVFHHNIRLAIGTAINVLLFKHIRKSPSIQSDVGRYIKERNAIDPNWINELIANEHKRGKHFLLSKSFLFKRLEKISPLSFSEQIKKAPIVTLGLIFDLALFLVADNLMRRGVGAGYW